MPSTLKRIPRPESIRADLGATLRRLKHLRRLLKLSNALHGDTPSTTTTKGANRERP